MSEGPAHTMQRILFGDNQFFGINHMSEEKALAQSIKFNSVESIIKVLDAAYDEGIKVFMCTTHDQIASICDHVRRHPERYTNLEFYPCMPYAHKYANAVTEHGMMKTIRMILPTEGIFGTLFKGGMSIAQKDIKGIAEVLIGAEMKVFHGLKTPVIFLQNVVTDLLLGLQIKDAFKIFSDIVTSKYNAEPGFITMNMIRLLDTLEDVGIDNPIVCANINKIAFRTPGGLQAYEAAIANRRFRPIAMSIFASGAIPAKEAVEYICRQPKIKSIVFGASSQANIRETKRLIDELTVMA